MNNEIAWRRLTIVYTALKSVLIQSEEFDPEQETDIQPILEQRSALDHIARAQAVRLGMRSTQQSDPDQYVEQQLDKALGHLYRGFFDAADWFSIRIRDQINDLLSQFDTQIVGTVWPDYFKETKPALLRISGEIAEIRENKDIIPPDLIIKEVEGYQDSIDELLNIHRKVSEMVPALTECKQDFSKRERATSSKAWKVGFITSGIVALVMFLLSYFGILPQISGTTTVGSASAKQTDQR